MPAAHTSTGTPGSAGFGTAAQLLRVRAQSLNLVAGALSKSFADFAGMLGAVPGRILVAGAGANDCVARYTARKFSSSGIPSLFAGTDSFGEGGISWLASPGDAMLLFAVREEDAFQEEVMFATSRMDIPLFLLTDQEDSPGGNHHILKLSGAVPPDGEREVSPLVYMALGEALAREIRRIRGMKDSSADAAKTLGGGRFRRVSEIMRKGAELPLLKGDAVLAEARTLLRRHAPCVVGVMKKDKLSGVISDADFRRMGSRIELDTPVTKAMRPPAATLVEEDSVAEALRLRGLMDLEVILAPDGLRVLEIDARFPSQTPTAVWLSTGWNLAEYLVSCFIPYEPAPGWESPRCVRYEHVCRTEDGEIVCRGEHVMAGAGPLEGLRDFFGADEALLGGDFPSGAWAATLMFHGATPEEVEARRDACLACLRAASRGDGHHKTP